MTILDLIALLIVAGICGALGQAITGDRAECASAHRWNSTIVAERRRRKHGGAEPRLKVGGVRASLSGPS